MSLPRLLTAISSRLYWLAQAFFICLLLAALATRPNLTAQKPVAWALLLIPAAWLTAWMFARLLDRPGRRWRWGVRSLCWPLAAFSFWAVAGPLLAFRWDSWSGSATEYLKAATAFALVWLLYLYLVNERPPLAIPLALVLLVQGAVAIFQVATQADLGLWWLGEPRLDPQDGGVIILLVAGQRWLRGYGLTGGPNTLGASLAFLLVYLLPRFLQAGGWRLWAWSLVISIGAVGLLASFSRSAVLSLGLGLATWAGLAWWRGRPRRLVSAWGRERWLALALPLVLAASYLLLHAPALASRFAPDANPLESRSIGERERDANLALTLISRRPLLGVGLGEFQAAAQALDPAARVVHNVPLLVMAELGVIGALLWLWLALAGLQLGWRSRTQPGWLLGLWLVFLVPGLFGPWWITVSWRVGVLFALALAAGEGTQGGGDVGTQGDREIGN